MSYDRTYKHPNRDYNFTYLDTAIRKKETFYFNLMFLEFIFRSPVYIGSSHGEEIDPIDLSSLTSCPITPMVTVPAEELVLLVQL